MILITGANGFVGQHLAPIALKYFKKSEILCVVCNTGLDLEERGVERLKKAGLKILYVDLVTKKNIAKLPKNPELVIHLAANTDTSKTNHQINDIGTKNLLDAIGPLDPKTHLIYTSTTVLMSGRKNCSKPFNENDLPAPSDEYGRSKLRAEKVLRNRAHQEKFMLTIVRPNTIYGPDPRKYKMFKTMQHYIEKGSILSRVNWPGKTALIHVDDVASALLKFTRINPQPGRSEIYILYSENLTMGEISEIMHNYMKIQYNPINISQTLWRLPAFFRNAIPFFEHILPADLYNWIWRSSLIIDDVIWCDTKKALKTLPNWKPKKLKDTIADVF